MWSKNGWVEQLKRFSNSPAVLDVAWDSGGIYIFLLLWGTSVKSVWKMTAIQFGKNEIKTLINTEKVPRKFF